MLPRGGDPSGMASVILIGRNEKIRTPTAKAIPAQNDSLIFFLLQKKKNKQQTNKKHKILLKV